MELFLFWLLLMSNFLWYRVFKAYRDGVKEAIETLNIECDFGDNSNE